MLRYAWVLIASAFPMSLFAQPSEAPVVAQPPAGSEAAGATASANSTVDDASVQTLIAHLGDASFAVREQATDQLRAMGPAILDELRSAYHESDNFEIRSKLRDVAESIDLQQRLFGSVGFLGVQPNAVVVNTLPGQPEAVIGIHIGFVVPGEAADKAGFQVDDVIVAVDGKRLPQGTDSERFASLLRESGPGAVLRFTILRNGEIIERSTALGQRPIEFYMGLGDSWYFDRLSDSISAFKQWWFEQDSTLDANAGRRFPSTLRFPIDWDPTAASKQAPTQKDVAAPMPANADASPPS